MLIRIEDRAIGTVEISTPDNAGMQQILDAICRAIGLFSCRYDGRDRYDFLSVLYDQIKSMREPGDGPKDFV